MDIQYILPPLPLSLFKTDNSTKNVHCSPIGHCGSLIIFFDSLQTSLQGKHISADTKRAGCCLYVYYRNSHRVTCHSTKAGCENSWKIRNHADVITTTVYIQCCIYVFLTLLQNSLLKSIKDWD